MQLRSTLLICFVWLLLLPATSTRAQEVSTDPPPAPVRLMAEWEESQALLVSWRNQHAILLREIVRHGSAECKVIIFADNPSAVSNYLSSGNVSLENVLPQASCAQEGRLGKHALSLSLSESLSRSQRRTTPERI